MANRFLESLEPPKESAAPSSDRGNRFLQSIEGVEFPEPSEGLLKSSARTLLQPVLGAAQRFTFPFDIAKLLSEGASKETLAQLAEEEPELKGGVAEQARQQAISLFPTQRLAEELIEEKTGAPLTPRTKVQKLVRLGSTAASFRPGGAASKATAGVAAPAISATLEAGGVPEHFAEPVGLALSGAAPTPSVSKVVKPSGLTTRRFENTSKPTKVSPARHEKITESVEQDFKQIADQLLQKNRTYSALKEDNLFKEKVGDLFEKVEDIAKDLPGDFFTQDLRDAFRKRYNSREMKGISPDEFERAFRSEVRSLNKSIPFDKMTATQMVDQFRKNNQSLRELFEPGKSSAYNRAKRESLLEYNRAIEDVITKKYPDTEFKDLFEFTNNRWRDISDIEQIDKFFGDVFEGKVNFKKAKEIFNKDKAHLSKPFKRILGDDAYKDFQSLIGDLVSTEKAMGYIKKAESAGFGNLAKTAGLYLIHPKLAATKLLTEHGKHLWQMLLDKPRLITTWKSSIDNLKQGNYAAAQEGFRELDKEFSTPNNNQDKTNPKSLQQ